MISDPGNSSSLSARARRKRVEFFGSLVAQLGRRDLSLLDVGGTLNYWKLNGPALPPGLIAEVDIVNLPPVEPARHQIHGIAFNLYGGNALNPDSLRLQHYDLIYSNSVIEHVGSLQQQRRMAETIRRHGRHHFVQTPSRTFPIEPHFYFPFFALLPLGIRTWLHQHFQMGFMGREPDWLEARIRCEETRLLTRKELTFLFPESRVLHERLCLMTKSFMVTNLCR